MICLLALLGAVGPFANYLIIPLMPRLAQVFDTPYAQMQLALTVYLALGAVGELVWGPLSDRFGRRPMMLTGLALFIVGTVICALAPNPAVLIFGRAIQAFGGVVGLVLGRVIASDLFGLERTASIIAYLTLIRFLGPMFAPAIGTAIDNALSWRAIFWLLLITACILILVTYRNLSETIAKDRDSSQTLSLASTTELLKTPAFWGYVINICGITGMLYAFLAEAPFIFVKVFGRTAGEFSAYFFIAACGYLLGNFLSGWFVVSVGTRRLILFGSGLAFLGLVLFWPLLPLQAPVSLFAPMTIIAIANGLVLPCTKARAVKTRERLSGTASGLFGAIQVGFAAVVTLTMGLTHDGTAIPMITGMTFCGVLAFCGYLAAARSTD
jgi:DHA1 family bicyclomycin/chloramphenicol resistance-like MFS transporter